MKKIGKIAACGLLATLGITAMTSCGNDDSKVSLAEEILNKVILTQDGTKVSEDFAIPKIVKHNSETYDVSWVSSDTSVLNIIENNDTQYTADVKLPFDVDTEVKLTASVTAGGQTASYEFKTTVQMIDAEKALNTAISNTGVKASYNEKVVLDLPAKSNEYKDEITFEYSLGGTYATAKLEGTQLTLDPETGSENVFIKVKATAGTIVVEKDVKTRVSKEITFLTVTDALAQPKDALISVQGRIKSIASDKYGNFWIVDEAGKEIEIYGLYQGSVDKNYANGTWSSTDAVRYDSWKAEEKLAVGDYVYVYGQRDTYNTTEEVKNCLIQDYPFLTVSDALEVAKGDFLSVYGEVKSIVNDKYGNIYLKDASGKEIYLYGLYQGDNDKNYPDGVWNSTGAVRYDSWKAEEKLAVGDVIAVYGPMDEYNGSKQVKNALLQVVLKKAPSTSTDPTPDPEPETPTTPTKPETPLTSATAKSTVDKAGQIHTFANPVTALGLNDYVFDVTYTAVTGTSSSGEEYANNPYLKNGAEIRLYGNKEGNGCSLTFKVIEGYKIDSITVTIATGDKGGVLQVSTSAENILTVGENGAYVVNGNTVTIKNVTSGNTNQLWIAQIDFVLSQTA
ncbi:MAG: hypothetical protein K2N64_05920 [Anaeroplasmataceae bacterium]|nr:hypothetical protein [Anaeroplasmataceae bacterium]